MPEADADFTTDVFDDTYLNMELEIPREGYKPDFTKAKKRLRDKDGLQIVRYHSYPILDTRIYGVEYKDRHKASLEANKIVEKIFAQLDGEVNQHVLFQEIVDHRYGGNEVNEQDAFITARTGIKSFRDTTKGVEVLVQWKDGRTTWATLKEMKNSHPVQIA